MHLNSSGSACDLDLSGPRLSPSEDSAFKDDEDRLKEEADKQRVIDYLVSHTGASVKPAKGMIRYPFCIPGGFYDQQWDWDGFFIASHLASREPGQPEYLKYWVLNVLNSVLPDGDVATCITPEGVRVGQPSLRLKPILAQAAELGGRLLGDDSWLADHFDEIIRIVRRREATHFDSRYGLFVWENAMQSGADNNPAVGNEPELARSRASCDVNAFHYLEYHAVAKLAARLGRLDIRDFFARKSSEVLDAINRHLWCESEESYWTMDVRKGEHLRCVSYSNFVPLWAGIVPPERARRMIKRYLWNPEHLLSPHGLRSLSIQDPLYNNENMIIPYSNWQGPVWPIANYFYFIGMIRYGFRGEAASLVRRLTSLYLNDLAFCGSLHENYDADTGKPMAPSAEQSKHGVEGGFLGWNLLLQDMIEIVDGRNHPLLA